MYLDERNNGWHDDEWVPEDDPLVQRLRNLQHFETPPGVRERCWEKIRQRLEELDKPLDPVDDPAPQSGSRHLSDRHAFSRSDDRPTLTRRTPAATDWSRSRSGLEHRPPMRARLRAATV